MSDERRSIVGVCDHGSWNTGRNAEGTTMSLGAVADVVRAARAKLGLGVGGIAHLEHINLVVGDKDITEAFYFTGLGLTRDPQRPAGRTIWANAGWHKQFHLVGREEGEPVQVVNGAIGLAVPSLDKVKEQLASVVTSGVLHETQFRVEDDVPGVGIAVRCPYGNLFHVYEARRHLPGLPHREPEDGMSRFEQLFLNEAATMSPRPGIPYVLFRVGPGCSAKIGEYYTKTLGACSVQVDETTVAVAAGANSLLLFVESAVDAAAVTQQEGLHLCIYITDFEASYSRVTPWTNPKFRRLDQCDTVAQAVGSRQFRFKDIMDGEKPLFELEHETRALSHSSFMKPLTYLE